MAHRPTVSRIETSASDALEALGQTGWDIVLLDGPPGSLQTTEDAIRNADFVLIPLRAGDQDLGSTEYVVAACI